MNLKKLVSFTLILTVLQVFSQDISLSTLLIDASLKENANAILQVDDSKIEISAINKYIKKYRRVITILNKNGLRHTGTNVYYNKSINIRKLEAIIYNSSGEEIKKIRKSDFTDVSAVSEITLHGDSRVKYLDYTPTEYPFTIDFSYEIVSQNSNSISGWNPLEGYYISTLSSSYEIVHNNISEFNIKERNINNLDIKNLSSNGVLKYEAHNLKAWKPERYSEYFYEIGPLVFVSMQNFHYEGYNGSAKDWEAFGKWYYNNLLYGRDDLPESTIIEVSNLVKGVEDPIEKAKIIYKYVQDKTRYISIQLGVGGWQPMLASEVDELSYGDCKALTNYTKALMESQGIEAYHTILFGSESLQNITKDFVSFQGNHMILNLPNDGNPIWLECTSQKVPFGHIANFTDDRDVLVVTPEGGRIEHTKIYSNKENYLKTRAEISITTEGGISANINSKSGGIQYDDRLNYVVDSDQKDRDKFYKEYWDYINGLSLKKIDIQNNNDDIEITENIKVIAPAYASKAGEKLLLNPNMFNRMTGIPPRYSERKLPFIIERGFYDQDEYIINLPDGYKLETSMQPNEIESQFGTYKASLEILSDTQVKYMRSFELNKGNFSKENYKDYRSFMRKIAKADKTSIVLKN